MYECPHCHAYMRLHAEGQFWRCLVCGYTRVPGKGDNPVGSPVAGPGRAGNGGLDAEGDTGREVFQEAEKEG